MASIRAHTTATEDDHPPTVRRAYDERFWAACERARPDMTGHLEDVSFYPRGHQLPTGFRNARQLADEAGISLRQVHYWTQLGHLAPEDCAAGSGYQRAYSDEEAHVARRIGELLDRGYRLGSAAQRAREQSGRTP